MLKSVRRMIVLLLLVTAMMPVVRAEDVFITRTGKFYYPASSPFVKTRATIRIPREEADQKGYKPSKSYLKAKEKKGRAPAAFPQEKY